MMDDQYDDGSLDVPSGLEGPVERVVVVGAGISGLAVANALAHAGVETVVLEARDRLGGRLHTIDLDGSQVDLGGSWIHHPVENPMRRLADRLGVRCTPGNPLPTLSGYDTVLGRRLSDAELAQVMDVQFETFDESLDGWRAALGPAASAADAVDAFLAAAGLDADGARRVRQGLRAGVEADAADRMELMSLQWMGNEIEYGGDLFGDLPVGGYGAVVAALAGGLDVRLGVEVDGIQVTGADVQVHTTDGHVEHASHVVVTVPLGVLKRGTPRLSPALPPAHLDAIGRLGFGRYEKVVLQFERPFWHDRGVSHLQVFPLDPDQPSLWVFDLAGFGFGPTLACHAFHSATPNVLDGSPDDAAHWALELLGQALGGPCPAPSAVAVTGWAHDPFSGGAYSHVPPGADPSLLDRIGTPVGGRVLFAGEHTQSARVGYADGALSSGVREAKRLLSAPSVRLGPIAAG